MPGPQWGPELIAQPAEWLATPYGETPMERPPSLQDELNRLSAEQK